MRCPKDDTDLIEVERQGIEIDYCPTCKGVWLDRRELDELITRSSAQVSYEEPSRDSRESRNYRDSRDDSRRKPGGLMGRVGELLDDDRDHDRDRRRRDWDDDDDDRYRGDKKKNRKRGMLGDLFDF